MTIWEKQILARAIGIQKRKLGVTTHFSEIIKQQYFKTAPKYKVMYGIFSLIEALIISEKCMVTPSFLLGYQGHLLSSAFSL